MIDKKACKNLILLRFVPTFALSFFRELQFLNKFQIIGLGD